MKLEENKINTINGLGDQAINMETVRKLKEESENLRKNPVAWNLLLILFNKLGFKIFDLENNFNTVRYLGKCEKK